VKPQSAYLIAYDIRDPRRLTRVYQLCKRSGLHLQYSVFLVRANPRQIDNLARELEALIHPRRDDIRIYPIPERAQWIHLGRPFWPDDVHFIDERIPSLQPDGERHKVKNTQADERDDDMRSIDSRDHRVLRKHTIKPLKEKGK
jgi:CRISPR-associated protein Cas2